MIDIRKHATERAENTPHAEADWLKALESAVQTLPTSAIDAGSLTQLISACQTPAQFTLLVRLIYQYEKSSPRKVPIGPMLLRFVNVSAFSVVEWVEAIEYFYHWLEERGRKAELFSMLQYLECCAASPEALDGGLRFRSLVEDMLRVCGYEGR